VGSSPICCTRLLGRHHFFFFGDLGAHLTLDGGFENALANNIPSVHRGEVADDAEAPSECRPLPPPLERAGEHVEQEQESDDDAVPHQVDVKAGLA
jgi:hypothetical protein